MYDRTSQDLIETAAFAESLDGVHGYAGGGSLLEMAV
jgi:hypothetical protein